jgi:outer membrane protein TolC
MIRIRNITLAFCLLSSVTNAQTQPETKHDLSVTQCIDYGLKNNVQVKNALLDISIQEQVNRGVTAQALPQLSASAGITHYPNVTVQTFPNFIAAATYGVLEHEGVKNGSGEPVKSPSDFGLIEAAFGTKWNANAGVALSQILFDGQVFVGLQARKTIMDFSQKKFEVTKEIIKANIYKVYYQLAASKTQVAQLDANIARAQKSLHDANVMYKNGFSEKLDVDRFAVQLANLQTQKANVETTISNGYLGLKVLIGMPIKDTLILTDSVTDDQIKQGLLNEGIYQYADRKEFQMAQLGKRLNEYDVKRYKLSKLPTASLSANYSKMAMRNKFDFYKGDWFPSSYLGLTVNVPIFSGFAKNANIQKAQLELQKTENDIDSLKISIDNEVAQATNNYHYAVIALDYQKKNMELAEQVYNQTKKKYEMGTASTTDITNAQSDLTIAQSNYINALYTAIVANVDYRKAIGKL